MSLEQDIAALTAQAGLLLDLPEQIATEATNQIQNISGTYQGILAAQNLNLYVDPVNGLDTAEGTLAAPLKTPQKAIDLCPLGGILAVNMMDDYHITANLSIFNKTVVFYGHSGIRRNITFDRYVESGTRFARGIRLGGSANLIAHTLRLVVPEVGPHGSSPASSSGLITIGSSFHSAPLNFAAIGCEIDIPAEPFCSIVGAGNLIGLTAQGNTYPGAIADPRGRLISGVTDLAGTDPATLSFLTTNLASV